MKTVLKTWLFFVGIILFSSCQQNVIDSPIVTLETKTITVASMKTNNQYWVKTILDPVWHLSSDEIVGFGEYIEGNEYQITVDKKSDGKLYFRGIVNTISKESDIPRLFPDGYVLSELPQEEIAFPSKNKSQCLNTNNEIVVIDDSLYIYQGDILLQGDQLEYFKVGQTKSCISKLPVKYWRNRRVYYTFAAGFDKQTEVLAAISEWESKTSLTFIYGTGNGDYIEFYNDDGCFSTSIGRAGGQQRISIDSGWGTAGNAMHEIGHAVGLFHEHCRIDRDSYITVHWNNIENNTQSIAQFYKKTTEEAQDIGSFDFNSIMMYGPRAFSYDENNYSLYTITANATGGPYETQRLYLSAGDVLGVKSIYGPPFQKLHFEDTNVYQYVDYLVDQYEYTRNYEVRFYSDEACTIPATLTHPRYIKVYADHEYLYNGSVYTTFYDFDVTVPAGVSSFPIGSTDNYYYYTAGNTDDIDVTNYGL